MRRLFYLLFLSVLFTRPVQAGTIQTHIIESSAINLNIELYVYEPTGYSPSGDPVPVIYFLHGGHTSRIAYFSVFDSLETAMARGDIEPSLIVMPYGASLSYWVDSPVVGNFEQHLFEEVMPFVESNYNVRTDRGSRAIMGHSMGGTSAVRIALQNPDKFVAFASHGGILGLHKMLEYIGPSIRGECLRPREVNPANGPISTFLVDCCQDFSPNLEQEFQCDLIMTYTGSIIESVWPRWAPFDPLTLVFEQGGFSGMKAYFDIGDVDTWYSCAKVMDDSLQSLDVPYIFRVYEGNHNQLDGQYPYSLSAIGDAFLEATGVDEQSIAQPVSPMISVSAWPNPFNSTCRISVAAGGQGAVSFTLFDILGREVMSGSPQPLVGGKAEYNLRATGLPSGVYLVRVDQGGRGQAWAKVVLTR